MKFNQTCRSFFLPTDIRTLRQDFLTLQVTSTSRRQNAQPGTTTWHAKFINPIID
jgi:hypothetical protein